jgi:hypothetical protein
MTTTTAVANKLNVIESAITRVEEWAHVLFVVVKGLGARFVSKRVIRKMELEKLDGSDKQIAWAEDLRSQFIKQIDGLRSEVSAHLAKDLSDRDRELCQINMAVLGETIGHLATQTSAKWFIDRRNMPTTDSDNNSIVGLLVPDADDRIQACLDKYSN